MWVDIVEVQVSRRPEASRQLGIIAFVSDVETVGISQGFTRDLPHTDRVVANDNPVSATPNHEVPRLSMAFPNRVFRVSAHVHIVVFHSADPEEEIERQVVEMATASMSAAKSRASAWERYDGTGLICRRMRRSVFDLKRMNRARLLLSSGRGSDRSLRRMG